MKLRIMAFLISLLFGLSIILQHANAVVINMEDPYYILELGKAIANHETSIEVEFKYAKDNFYQELFDSIPFINTKLSGYINLDYGLFNYKNSEFSYFLFGINDFSLGELKLEYRETPKQTKYVYDTVHNLIKNNSKLKKASNYEKLIWIYDYITKNVKYDNSLKKYTAYEALKHGTAVCQGYVMLFYAMATELGVNCHIVSGTGNGEAHAWNIVELRDKWYYVDATWGASGGGRDFFLKAKKNMKLHQLLKEYESCGFQFATSDYKDTGNSGYSGIMGSVYNIKFDLLKKQVLKIGNSFNWLLSNSDGIELTFQSEDETVCSIDKDGKVEATGKGSTLLHAINKSKGIDQICEVTVFGKEETPKIQAKIVGYQEITISYNTTKKIKLEIFPRDGKLDNARYKTMNNEIATVDRNGVVTLRIGTES